MGMGMGVGGEGQCRVNDQKDDHDDDNDDDDDGDGDDDGGGGNDDDTETVLSQDWDEKSRGASRGIESGDQGKGKPQKASAPVAVAGDRGKKRKAAPGATDSASSLTVSKGEAEKWWVCLSCTFRNTDLEASLCEICDQRRAQKFVRSTKERTE